MIVELKCEYCGDYMRAGETWGDDYYEPKEQEWICPYCNARAWTTYCTIQWEAGRVEKELEDE